MLSIIIGGNWSEDDGEGGGDVDGDDAQDEEDAQGVGRARGWKSSYLLCHQRHYDYDDDDDDDSTQPS